MVAVQVSFCHLVLEQGTHEDFSGIAYSPRQILDISVCKNNFRGEVYAEPIKHS